MFFTACGTCTDLTSIGGIIRSPDYPGNYGNNRNCSYTIEVPLEAKIKLDFTTFTVEEGHDFISVCNITYIRIYFFY